jgi:hypothetical protein
LVEEFRARVTDDPHIWIECTGERFFESTPFHVVTQMLDQGLGWRGDETDEERSSQLERSLASAGMDLHETFALIAELLNVPTSEQYPPLTLGPEQTPVDSWRPLATWVLSAPRLCR